MSMRPPPAVAGITLDGPAPYVIDPEENAALCRALGTEPDPKGRAHHIYYFIATQVGMGSSVSGICEICHFDVDDGPMIGASKVEFQAPLWTAQPYVVRGEIRNLVRKPSRKLGVIDVLDYQLRLLHPDGALVLTSTNSWILPRKDLT